MEGRTKLLTIAGNRSIKPLEDLLRKEFEVFEAGDNPLKRIKECKPDAAIVDVASGIENVGLIREAHNSFSELPILAIVPDLSDQLEMFGYSLPCICSGAKGIVAMKSPYEQAYADIKLAVPELINRGVYPKDKNLAKQICIINNFDADLKKLSPAERRVFAFCVGYPLSVGEIALQLHLSPKTVETHLRHINKKVGFPGRNKMIFYGMLYALGYIGNKDGRATYKITRSCTL